MTTLSIAKSWWSSSTAKATACRPWLTDRRHWSRWLALPAFADRTVSLEFERHGDAAEILITGQGDGFDWTPYLELDPTRAFHVHGRGIAIARKMSFESVEYLGKENRVLACLAQHRAAPAAPATPSEKALA